MCHDFIEFSKALLATDLFTWGGTDDRLRPMPFALVNAMIHA
jgi:hypothetical protein